MSEFLYLGPGFVVCRKAAGLLAEKTDGAPSLPMLLEKELGGTVFPVHRLDRETEGVMVFARTKPCAAALSKAFAGGAVQKEYRCLTAKPLPERAGEMQDSLLHDPKKNRSRAVPPETRGAKEARLSYALLAERERRFLWGVRLYTGRTHQIRVQFALRGAPLVGDRKYGGIPSPGLFLSCCSLSFPHPETGERLCFTLDPAEPALRV